jgi:amidase
MYWKLNWGAFIAGTAAGAASAMLGIALAMAQAGPPSLSQTGAGIASFPVVEASVAGLEAAYLSGQITARAITQAHLDRIAAYDKRGPLINSLIFPRS